jgi:hypothetical protein
MRQIQLGFRLQAAGMGELRAPSYKLRGDSGLGVVRGVCYVYFSEQRKNIPMKIIRVQAY